MPVDKWAQFAQPVPSTSGADPWAQYSQVPSAPAAPQPTQSAPALSAAPPDSWLKQAENDFTEGGKRTALGKILGILQGNNSGYSGIDSGESKSAANFMGSPVLGLLHAGQSAQTIPDHPVTGTLGTIGGLAEAATIPSMVMGGPGATTAIEAVPSKVHAAQVLQSLMEAHADRPIELLRTLEPLQRTQELRAVGATTPPAANALYDRINSVMANPINYQQARDFASELSRPSVMERLTTKPEMLMNARRTATGLNADIGQSIGQPEVYGNAIKEYAQAAKLANYLKVAGVATAGYAARKTVGGGLASYLKTIAGQ